MTIDRRRFVLTSLAATATLRASSLLAQAPSATLILHRDQPGPTIPSNFVGLSYETQQLSDPSFFSPANTGLITQFRALSPQGVLRIGGNTSDVGWFRFTPTTKQPTIATRAVVTGEPSAQQAYFITPEAIHNLRAFLEATNWTCLYGINLGTGTPDRAAEEAALVNSILGSRLEYFQVGNEVDLFDRHMRDPKTWSPDTFVDEWLIFADAIRARVPHAQFGLPDVAAKTTWLPQIADRLAAVPAGEGKGTRPHIAALTHHFYFGGPPSNPDVNIERLLQPDPRVTRDATLAHDAAAKLSAATHYPILYRMTEGNTCYRGGKPGVSDVFAASLWAADYFLKLAAAGYAGVNLHGGSRNQVAASLGGTLPGEALLADPKAPGPRPFYTPIADINGAYVAEPVFHGMRFAQQLAGGTIIPLTFSPGAVNATAYAAKLPTGQTAVAIINKDSTQPLPLDLAGFGVAHIMTAKSLTSATVDELEPDNSREASSIPPATAMLLLNTRG
jgi:hypothetical protein